jgi:hypothetical protein
MIWGFVCVVLSSHFSYYFGGVLSTHSGWVLVNVVWTDSWLSIAGVGSGLICVGAGEEWVRKVYALWGLRGVERQVGLTRGTQWPVGSSAGRMVARKARRSQVRFLGWASKPRWSRCRVAAHNRSLHAGFGWFTPQNQHRAGTTWRPSHEWDWRGGCTESAGFAAVHHKTVGVTWLSHKTKTGSYPSTSRSFEAGDMRHDWGVCVGRTWRPDKYAAVRWRTSCVDQNAPVRAWVVTPSVGVLRSFPEGLYIGGGGWIFSQLFGL